MGLIAYLSDSDIDEEKEEEMIRNIELEGDLIVKNLLPKKSCEKYEKVYEEFQKWCTASNVSTYTERTLLVYFDELSKKFKPSSLWSRWSMLKTTLRLRHDVRLDDFYNLKTFLKNFGKGYRSKKAKVFTWSQIEQFLEGSDDYLYLAMKVIVTFGICGALRCHEICDMKKSDVEDTGSQFVVTVRDTKTYYPRTFVIGPKLYQKVKKYIDLRPMDFESDRFFVVYQKGKCCRSVIGKNKISEVPKIIASYLNLKDVELYTGHSFRRTAATLLSNSGANLVDVKSLGGWRSDAVAQGYIDNSLANNRKIFDGIVNSEKISSFAGGARKSGKSFPLQEIHNLPGSSKQNSGPSIHNLNDNSVIGKRLVNEESIQVSSHLPRCSKENFMSDIAKQVSCEQVHDSKSDMNSSENSRVRKGRVNEESEQVSCEKVDGLSGCLKQNCVSNIDFNGNSRIEKRGVNEESKQASCEEIQNGISDGDVGTSKKRRVSSLSSGSNVKNIEDKEIDEANFGLCAMRFFNCVIHNLTVNHSSSNDKNVNYRESKYKDNE